VCAAHDLIISQSLPLAPGPRRLHSSQQNRRRCTSAGARSCICSQKPTFVQRQAQAVGARPPQLLGRIVRPPCSSWLRCRPRRRRCRRAHSSGHAPEARLQSGKLPARRLRALACAALLLRCSDGKAAFIALDAHGHILSPTLTQPCPTHAGNHMTMPSMLSCYAPALSADCVADPTAAAEPRVSAAVRSLAASVAPGLGVTS
jgi:hypothetical protein